MLKTIDSQGYKLIAALINYFETERDNGGPLSPIIREVVRERVAAALNISMGTVNNIAYKMKNNTLDSPKKTRLHTKWVMSLDHLDIGSIRDQIYEIYKNKKIVGRENIHKRVRHMQFFKGCKISLHTLL
ncbi:uncharacterized protein LOC143200022 [Rhynchophorus ferrugineus]|uniref:uncharacterized protein LOC143200022 n=1 Tax=Rhynchophorus ferrugineus TaxID=354439 RepID=UPI003FCDC07F